VFITHGELAPFSPVAYLSTFRDSETMDDFLNLEPPEDGIARIEWHPRVLDEPVNRRGDGYIWSARTYCARLRAAGIRAGFLSITNHDFRPGGLRAIGEFLLGPAHGF
jgi:hypothetical protein